MKSGRDSAARTLSGAQVLAGIGMVVMSVLIVLLNGMAFAFGAVAVTMVGYAVVMTFKSWVTFDAVRHGPIKVSRFELRRLERELPSYTVIVPLYNEAPVVKSLLASLGQLDYPRHKLQILLLCEGDDDATLGALSEANLGQPFEIVVIEPSHPRTKPKVCNVGLERATGRYLVVYDAEDRPQPDQLKKAVVAFRKMRRRVVCLQARLQYRNPNTNLLTRFFASEYGTFYDMLLPSLARRGLPVPLGGTSNHFRTAALRTLGGWDSFNVTEDLDLGMCIARRGWRVEILDSITWEEANSRVGNWVRQRSRWLKGYMQTYLVHMRSPMRLRRELGTGNFLAFQLLVGGTPVMTLLNPILWAMTLAYGLTGSPLIQELFPAPVFYVGITSMVVGNFAFVYYLVTGAVVLGHYRNAKWMLLAPLYWLLMSCAAWKAALQLMARPHYWEKTAHGLVEEKALEPLGVRRAWDPHVLRGGVEAGEPAHLGARHAVTAGRGRR